MRKLAPYVVAFSLFLGTIAAPAPAGAAIGDPEQRAEDYCFFLPDSRAVGNCTTADLQMYLYRQEMNQLVTSGMPSEMWEDNYLYISHQAQQLQDAFGPQFQPADAPVYGNGNGTQSLHISMDNEYLVRDSKWVGSNVRYASIKVGNNKPALLVLDALARPMKLQQGYCETTGGWIAHNIVLPLVGSYFGGKVVGALPTHLSKAFELVNAGTAAAALERTSNSVLFVTMIAIDTPDIGSCEMLVDVLNTPGSDGSQYVYRNRVILDADGGITPKPWTNLFNMDTGYGYWKQFGPVEYNGDGNPVW